MGRREWLAPCRWSGHWGGSDAVGVGLASGLLFQLHLKPPWVVATHLSWQIYALYSREERKVDFLSNIGHNIMLKEGGYDIPWDSTTCLLPGASQERGSLDTWCRGGQCGRARGAPWCAVPPSWNPPKPSCCWFNLRFLTDWEGNSPTNADSPIFYSLLTVEVSYTQARCLWSNC